MPNFQYKGRNREGSLVSGQLWASSIDAVVTELTGNNIIPIDISEGAAREEGTDKSRSGGWFSGLRDYLSGNKVQLTELIMFTRQMFSMTKAGIPLDKALKGIEGSTDSPALKKILRDIGGELEKGMSLTDAFSKHPRVFSPLFLSMLHVGENTGRLDLAFEQNGHYLNLERDTRKQIKSATRYPLFVIVAIAVALAIITVFVIPVFAATFERLGADLPWQTIVLINISDFTVNYWYIILIVIAMIIVLFRQYISTRRGRLVWDRRKLRLPIVGTILERIALGRFARTFSMMMSAGVPIVQALGVIARAVGNRYIGKNVRQMRDGISKGETLHMAAVKSGMFTPLVLQMIAVGEESGNIDELLSEVADFYDAEVEYDLKRLSSAIEPVLIVFIAGMVLVLALGVFLPIWDLANAAG